MSLLQNNIKHTTQISYKTCLKTPTSIETQIDSQMTSKLQASMNLPVQNHIARLSQLIEQMRIETDQAQKDLHILRGCISQLSFVNKQSDQDLNEYLLNGINLMRNKWATSWEEQNGELAESHKKLSKLLTQHEDIQIKREELEERVVNVQAIVGLV